MSAAGTGAAAISDAIVPIAPNAVRAYTASCALGVGLDALAAGLAANRSALHANDLPGIALDTAVGRVDGIEAMAWDEPAWDSRATRLAWMSLQADGFADAVAAARDRHGAGRVGLVLGTAASTIAVTEQAYRALAADGGFPAALRHEALNTPQALAALAQRRLALDGPALTVSTACSSGAQALAVAERWLRLGVADAVVAGGVDALGGSLLHGFAALQVLDARPCRPFDATRRGISIGEAGAWLLLERGTSAVDRGELRLRGHGVANDAHHMSSPHPQGLGAEMALDAALARAGMDAEAIDLVHLHGTGTPANDAVEAALVARRYRADVHACGTKGLTGHAMGAAGALGAVVALLALERGLLPGSAPTAATDPALGAAFGARWRATPRRGRVRRAVCHSFGFGGHDVVLVFSC